MEKKKSFAERYPNHRTEQRNEKLENMLSAAGWWKVYHNDLGESWIEAVAFFAKVTYEERTVWDGGYTAWEYYEVVFANTGNGEDWYLDCIGAQFGNNSHNERLFYDPDFRLSRDQQFAGQEWLTEMQAETTMKAATSEETKAAAAKVMEKYSGAIKNLESR